MAGTHITVEEVRQALAAWGTLERLRTAHSALHLEAVRAALECAADKVHGPVSPHDVLQSTESPTFIPRPSLGKQM